ncbi:hypothetical protein JCM9533A_40530 [Catenuloplanes niger JCM 9533]
MKVRRVQADEDDGFPLLVLTMRQDGEEAQYALMPEQVRRMAEVFDELLELQSRYADQASDNGGLDQRRRRTDRAESVKAG